MSVSSVSSSTSLASQATGMAAEEIALQLSVAIMKQAQDQQKIAGQAIVNMINQASSLDGTGQIINKAV
ncbi:MAG: putative motility protein [Anaerolineales bacterium]|nr:putative motility protein [Anaerolineales bacterium]